MSFKSFKSNDNDAVLTVTDTANVKARVFVFGSAVDVPTENPKAEKAEAATATLASLRVKSNNGKK